MLQEVGAVLHGSVQPGRNFGYLRSHVVNEKAENASLRGNV